MRYSGVEATINESIANESIAAIRTGDRSLLESELRYSRRHSRGETLRELCFTLDHSTTLDERELPLVLEAVDSVASEI